MDTYMRVSFLTLALFLIMASSACNANAPVPQSSSPSVSEATPGRTQPPEGAAKPPATNSGVMTGPQTIGRIQATVNGKARTWTVVDDGDCLWGAIVGGKTVSILGYEDLSRLSASQINFKSTPWGISWEQPYDLGGSRFIIEFTNPSYPVDHGSIDVHSNPRNGAVVGDSIRIWYTSADGNYIQATAAILADYVDNGNGTMTLNGRFTVDRFDEMDSQGLDHMEGITDGTFAVTEARVLNDRLVEHWLELCVP